MIFQNISRELRFKNFDLIICLKMFNLLRLTVLSLLVVAIGADQPSGLDFSSITSDKLSRFIMENRKFDARQGCVRFGLGVLHEVGVVEARENSPGIENIIAGVLTDLSQPEIIQTIKLGPNLAQKVINHCNNCVSTLDSEQSPDNLTPDSKAFLSMQTTKSPLSDHQQVHEAQNDTEADPETEELESTDDDTERDSEEEEEDGEDKVQTTDENDDQAKETAGPEQTKFEFVPEDELDEEPEQQLHAPEAEPEPEVDAPTIGPNEDHVEDSTPVDDEPATDSVEDLAALEPSQVQNNEDISKYPDLGPGFSDDANIGDGLIQEHHSSDHKQSNSESVSYVKADGRRIKKTTRSYNEECHEKHCYTETVSK